jgi:hypothetical protein
MKDQKQLLKRIINEVLQDIPTPDELEEWWVHMAPGSIRRLSRKLRVPPDPLKWNARDWEVITDYYVQVEMGDTRGYQRGRNI